MRTRVILMALVLLAVLGIAWVAAAGQQQQTGTQPVRLVHYVFNAGDMSDRARIDPHEYSGRALSGAEDLYDLDLEMRRRFSAVTGPNAVYVALGPEIAWDKHFIVPVIDGRVPGAVYGNDDSLKVVNQFQTPAFLELLDYTNRLIELNLMRNTDLVRDPEGFRRYRAAGEVIQPIAAGGTYKPGGQEEEEIRWEHLYYQVQMTPATLTTGGMIATMLAVNSQSRNIEKAVELPGGGLLRQLDLHALPLRPGGHALRDRGRIPAAHRRHRLLARRHLVHG